MTLPGHPGTSGVPMRCCPASLVQAALEAGLPVQFHCGYGDNDLDLDAADPVHLTPMLRATEGLGVPILLLHDYPFHRRAGYLAQVFTHVSTDLGLATHNVGARSAAVLAEALELVAVRGFPVLLRRVRAAGAVPAGIAALPARSRRVPGRRDRGR